MVVSFACDHGGLELKKCLAEYADSKGYSIIDFGTFDKESCDYPDFGVKVATSVAKGESDFGVCVCTTGIGMSMVANKVDGARCALCHSENDAEMTRRHNNANILALGQKTLSEEQAKSIFDIFMTTAFEGGRHLRRVNKITDIENGDLK